MERRHSDQSANVSNRLAAAVQVSVSQLYEFLTRHRLISISVIFTALTIFDSSLIVIGVVDGKEGTGPYVHMIARFVLLSVGVYAVAVAAWLSRRNGNGLLIGSLIYLVSLGMILSYVWLNGLYIDLHPDAYADAFVSFSTVFVIIAVLLAMGSRLRSRGARTHST
jgi:hypothetical protein